MTDFKNSKKQNHLRDESNSLVTLNLTLTFKWPWKHEKCIFLWGKRVYLHICPIEFFKNLLSYATLYLLPVYWKKFWAKFVLPVYVEFFEKFEFWLYTFFIKDMDCSSVTRLAILKGHLPISKFSKIFGRSEIRPNFEKFEYWLWHL